MVQQEGAKNCKGSMFDIGYVAYTHGVPEETQTLAK